MKKRNAMLQSERLLRIRDLLVQSRVVTVTELVSSFRVSANTVRRDLKVLAGQGLARLTHGGAYLEREAPMGLPLGQRKDTLIEEKRAIGRRAAEMVKDGDTILLDAGSTTEQIALALRERKRLTVITNALNIALELSSLPEVTVVLTGGILNEVTGCTAGFHAGQFLSQFHVAKAFISAGGVTAEGLSNTNAFEVQIKQCMIRIAEEVILVATSNKIGRSSLAPFAKLEDFDCLITDKKAPPEQIEALRARKLQVILC